MSLVLANSTGNSTFTQTGDGISSVEHKDLTRALNAPLVLVQEAKIGPPTALGNDHIKVTIRNSVADANNAIVTGSITMDVSIPRNSAFTATYIEDTITLLKSYLSVSGMAAALRAGQLNRS